MNTAERAAIRDFIGQCLAGRGGDSDFSDDEPLFSSARLELVVGHRNCRLP